MDTIQIPLAEIQCALDAMEWTFNPYLDDPVSIHDYPFIIELINAYNSMSVLLPEPVRLQYPLISF